MIEVYRDQWIVVIDKPSGTPAQRTRDGFPGVFEDVSDQFPYVALHHRLDRGASGLMVLSLHERANRRLTEAFRSHAAKRMYNAVLFGVPATTRWHQPIDGKSAGTQIDVIGTKMGMTAVEVQLTTGRKHQIRVHAAMAGAPVVGDRRYGPESARVWPRLCLHAARLELAHPVSGDQMKWTSAIPQDLSDLWSRIV